MRTKMLRAQSALVMILLPLRGAGRIDSLIDASKTAFNQGHYAEAETAGRQALELAEPDGGQQTALCLNNLAAAVSVEGKYSEAEELYRRALRIWEDVPGNELQAAITLGNLGVVLSSEASYAEAEIADRQSLETLERLAGPEDQRIATALNNLGELYNREGQFARAE